MVAQAEMARLKNALSDAQQKLADDADKIAAMKSARAPQGSIEAIAAERDQLKEELARRSRDLADAEAHRDQSAPAAALAAPAGSDAQVEQLRARLAVLEAQSVPYTPEELAVMKSNPSPPLVQANEPVPAPAPASPAAPAPERPHVVHSMKDLPPGAGALMTEAQRAMMQRDFAGAAEKYGDILHQDENNVYVLDHLAAAQCAMSHMTDLEKTVARALALDPDDPTSLRFLGILRYHEEKLDEALNALSLSAKYNPTNADTQYYLGSVLADKGLRPASETAFRKALEADPQFADAHFRLAVVYADEKPPSIELARWHYRRALDLGHPKNPALEKTLMPSP
jgi:tetratricopeptide (TPR) repeat protein